MKRTLILAVFVALAVKLATTPTVGTGFERSEAPIWGLPKNASDIDFVMRPYMPVSAYSFTTDERSFVAWTDNYLGLTDVHDGHASIEGIAPESSATTLIECENGVRYTWTEEDRGQYTMFDRGKRRAYYFSRSRQEADVNDSKNKWTIPTLFHAINLAAWSRRN